MAKDVRDFSKTAADLRDKTVVASFDMKEVKRVRLTDEGRAVLARIIDVPAQITRGKGSNTRYVTNILPEGKPADSLLVVANAIANDSAPSFFNASATAVAFAVSERLKLEPSPIV